MSRVYLCADLHFGHRNILNFRSQFSSVEEHDEIIVDNICSKLTRKDTLYLGGDCFFDENSIKHLEKIVRNVRHVNLILGNHDTDNKVRQDTFRKILDMGLIRKVHSLVKYNGCWLSHAPIHPDELHGKYCVHGHTHNHNIEDKRYFNMSLENIDYKPILFTDVKDILENG